LTLSHTALAALVQHARDASPDECCGLLIGRGERIDEARPARNVADRPRTRFVIDPRDHVKAIRGARAGGLDVVGYYHSHPRSAAEPSETDRAEAAYPGQLFLIVGLGADPPDVRLYRFADGNFLQVPFVTVG